MTRIEVEGVRLRCEERGEGPPVLLVHGLGGSTHSWWPQLEDLAAAGYRAIAYDQRGHGLTPRGGDLSVERWALDAVALCDALDVEAAVLVGHSVGCMVAQRAALELEERCRGLALVGGTLRWPEPAAAVFAERSRLAREGRMDEIGAAVLAGAISERRRRDDPALAGLLAGLVAANDPESYAAACEATAAATMADPGRIASPAIAIAGELDAITSLAAARDIAAAIRGCRVAVVPRAAHWCQLEEPGELNRILLDFLDRASSPSSHQT